MGKKEWSGRQDGGSGENLKGKRRGKKEGEREREKKERERERLRERERERERVDTEGTSRKKEQFEDDVDFMASRVSPSACKQTRF